MSNLEIQNSPNLSTTFPTDIESPARESTDKPFPFLSPSLPPFVNHEPKRQEPLKKKELDVSIASLTSPDTHQKLERILLKRKLRKSRLSNSSVEESRLNISTISTDTKVEKQIPSSLRENFSENKKPKTQLKNMDDFIEDVDKEITGFLKRISPKPTQSVSPKVHSPTRYVFDSKIRNFIPPELIAKKPSRNVWTQTNIYTKHVATQTDLHFDFVRFTSSFMEETKETDKNIATFLKRLSPKKTQSFPTEKAATKTLVLENEKPKKLEIPILLIDNNLPQQQEPITSLSLKQSHWSRFKASNAFSPTTLEILSGKGDLNLSGSPEKQQLSPSSSPQSVQAQQPQLQTTHLSPRSQPDHSNPISPRSSLADSDDVVSTVETSSARGKPKRFKNLEDVFMNEVSVAPTSNHITIEKNFIEALKQYPRLASYLGDVETNIINELGNGMMVQKNMLAKGL